MWVSKLISRILSLIRFDFIFFSPFVSRGVKGVEREKRRRREERHEARQLQFGQSVKLCFACLS